MLNRNSFLVYTDLPREEVQVPALGGSVFVRVLTAFELDAFENANSQAKGSGFRARLVVATACDESGVDLLKVEDFPAVLKMSSAAIEPIVSAALRINKMRPEDTKELEKNSSAPSTGLPID